MNDEEDITFDMIFEKEEVVEQTDAGSRTSETHPLPKGCDGCPQKETDEEGNSWCADHTGETICDYSITATIEEEDSVESIDLDLNFEIM